jgi:hypothetical protein
MVKKNIDSLILSSYTDVSCMTYVKQQKSNEYFDRILYSTDRDSAVQLELIRGPDNASYIETSLHI